MSFHTPPTNTTRQITPNRPNTQTHQANTTYQHNTSHQNNTTHHNNTSHQTKPNQHNITTVGCWCLFRQCEPAFEQQRHARLRKLVLGPSSHPLLVGVIQMPALSEQRIYTQTRSVLTLTLRLIRTFIRAATFCSTFITLQLYSFIRCFYPK